MPAAPPNRSKPGKNVSKLDRDTSKKNVALSKADQQREMAAKNFIKHQKELRATFDQLRKVKAAIDKLIEEKSKDLQLEARFLNQVIGKVKGLQNFEKLLKDSAQQYAGVVDQPKVYATVLVEAKKMPQPTQIKVAGDFAIFLAMAIVILKRLLTLKTAK